MGLRVVIPLVLVMAPAAANSLAPAPEPLVLIHEAYRAARQNLRSGTGTGTLEVYAREKGQEKWERRIKAKVEVWFDGDHSRIRAVYEENKLSGVASAISVRDGTVLVVNRFSPAIRPRGAEAEMYPPDLREPDGFPGNPARLPEALLNVDQVVKKYGSTVKVSERAGGGYVGTFSTRWGPVKFEASPESGHNIVSAQLFLRDGTFLANDCKATWGRSGDLWYVKSLSRQEGTYEESATAKDGFVTGYESRVVFTYDRFEPNAKVPPEKFRFAALELPEGARLLDHRPDVAVRVYYNRPPAGIDPKKEGLWGYIKALPHDK